MRFFDILGDFSYSVANRRFSPPFLEGPRARPKGGKFTKNTTKNGEISAKNAKNLKKYGKK